MKKSNQIEGYHDKDLVWHYEKRHLLVSMESGQDALQTLVAAFKARSKHFTLGLMSKKTGASKGYISDVLKGRRKLNRRYWDAFGELFGLEGIALVFFLLLLELDQTSEDTELRRLTAELQCLRKELRASYFIMPKVMGLYFAFEVACTFGLFGNCPSREELKSYYGTSRAIELDYALHHLMSMGIIEKADDRYRLIKDFVWFFDDEGGITATEYLKQSIMKAYEGVDKWSAEKDRSLIESSIISVKLSELKQKLPVIRDTFHRMQSELETNQADCLIHFNVQLFPNK